KGGIASDDTTGKSGCGPACEEAIRNLELHRENRTKAQEQYNSFMAHEYWQGMERAKTDYGNKHVNQSFDFLSKFKALNEIMDRDESNSAFWLSWGIRILFILFEIIPSLIKLMTSPTEYDFLLKSRLHMNQQLAFARANDALVELEEDIHNITQNDDTVPLPYMDQIKQRIMN
ncbi:MAG: DUF4407 domain-containing protein, partial [Flavobacteriaceae bacterium]